MVDRRIRSHVHAAETCRRVADHDALSDEQAEEYRDAAQQHREAAEDLREINERDLDYPHQRVMCEPIEVGDVVLVDRATGIDRRIVTNLDPDHGDGVGYMTGGDDPNLDEAIEGGHYEGVMPPRKIVATVDHVDA